MLYRQQDQRGPERNAYRGLTDASQKATLSWFDRFLTETDDYVVIYRPHPVELSSPQVREVAAKHPDSFRCIQDYEVKQWLKVADIPCTWLSTAISESYFIGKNCLVFRPCPIPPDVDCVLYQGVRAAENYESFRTQILGYDPGVEAFPIDRNLIEYYYDFSPEPAYRKIADVVDGPLPEAQDLDTTGRKIRNRRFREKFFVEEWEKTVDNRINNSRGIQLKEQKFKEIVERKE